MKYIFRLIAIALFIFYSSNILCAQEDSSVISQIKTYASYLDSIDKLNHPQNLGFKTFVEDGIIQKDGVVIGGYGIYTLLTANNDTALRIEYHNNLDINIYKTYYYKNDKLIYAIVKLHDGRDNLKSIYRREEFYNDNNVIWTNIEKVKKAKRYLHKINFSLYEDGLKFLNDFNNNNRH